MPSFILKPEPDDEKYVVWSSIVDAPTAYGTPEELNRIYFHEMTQERFDRADATGTSLKTGEFGWDLPEDVLIVGEVGSMGFFMLQRKNLKAFIQALDSNTEGTEGENKVLLEHCEPCEE